MTQSLLDATAYAWIGWVITMTIQVVLWYVLGLLGEITFKRLRRVYHLTVICYWLDRFEREGHRTFQRPD